MERMILKESLQKIKADGFKVPEGTDAFKLALDMVFHIGDTDPELRDSLIYEVLCNFVVNGIFSKDKLKELLYTIIDDNHLFYKIGEECTDSIFTRSFSVLASAVMMYAYRSNHYLSDEELAFVKDRLIRYTKEEKDVRGYDSEKGWAHSAAHTADVLDELAQCEAIGKDGLIEILGAIKDKTCISYYSYCNDEEERLSVAVASLIKRDVLSEDEVTGWIKSFGDTQRSGKLPEDQYLFLNIKNLLRSIYFRLLYEEGYTSVLEAIKEILLKIKRF